MTTNEKIAALRAAAKAAGADGVLIMTSDPHCSEYLPGYYNALPWFSGFIGENSTLVVTQTGSALWCDGRFYVQADKQLAGSEIECMHAGSAGVPTVAEYLGSHFADGQTLLLDGSCVPATIAKEYIDALAKKGASLKSQDVASPIWDATGERPALPDTPCELLTPAQTGATAADRIAMVRAELQKAGATALAVTGLDCVGWLLNLRARDLPCTPLAVAYALVTMDACTLFIAPGRLSDADTATLAESGVTLRGYEEIIDAVHALPRRRGVPGGREGHQLRPVRGSDRPQDRGRCRPDFCPEGHQERDRAEEPPRVPYPRRRRRGAVPDGSGKGAGRG